MSNNEIRIDITVDASGFQKKSEEVKVYARDTKKELDRNSYIKYQLDVASFQQKLDEARQKLREAKKDGDKNAQINARLEVNKLQSDVTEAKKILRDYVNVGEVGSSRLSRLFGSIGGTIKSSLNGIGGLLAGVFATSQITSFIFSIDEAKKTIGELTGATGDNLKSLQNDFKEVLRSVDDTSVEVANAIGEINTRFGLTGKPLQDLTRQFLDFADVTNQDVSTSVRDVSRLLQDSGYGIENASKLMDILTVASQKTGINVGTLATQTTNYGVQLRALGFGLEESVALISKFEAEGVNTEAILAGLNKGLNTLATQSGTDIPTAFASFITSLEDAKTDSEALALASEVLGAKAGPQLALAVREGRFELDEYLSLLEGSAGATEKTAQETETVQEKFQRLGNELKVSVLPVVVSFIEAIKPLIDGLTMTATEAPKTTGAIVGLSGALGIGFSLFVALGGPLTAIVAGITALGGAALYGANTFAKLKVLDDITIKMQENKKASDDLQSAYEQGKISAEEYSAKMSNLKLELYGLERSYNTAEARTQTFRGRVAKRFRDGANDAITVLIALANATNNFLARGIPSGAGAVNASKGVPVNINTAPGVVRSIPIPVNVKGLGAPREVDNTFTRIGAEAALARDIVKDLNDELDIQSSKITLGSLNKQLSGLKEVLLNAEVGSPLFKSIQKDIQETEERIRSLDLNGGGGGGGGSPKKNNSEKEELEKQKKALEEMNKAILETKKNIKDMGDKRFKELEKSGKHLRDELTKKVEENNKAIEKLQDKLKDIDKDILGNEVSLAQRTLNVQKNIKDINDEITKLREGGKYDYEKELELIKERTKLEEELALATKNVNKDILEEQRKENEKSETQKILDKKLALETQKKVLEEQLLAEQEALKMHEEFKVKLEEGYIKKVKKMNDLFNADFAESLKSKEDAWKKSLDNQLVAYKAHQEAMRALEASASASTTTNIDNSKNITQSFTYTSDGEKSFALFDASKTLSGV